MPFVDPLSIQNQSEPDSPLTQARRKVCSTLRRALHAMRAACEEQTCLDALEYEESGEVNWQARNTLIERIQGIRDPELLRIVALEAPCPHIQFATIWCLINAGQASDQRTQLVLRTLAQTSGDKDVAGLSSMMLEAQEMWSAAEPDTIANVLTSPMDLRKSILNPRLPTLCAQGYLDPDDLLDRELIECLVFACGYENLKYLLPNDRLDERIERWWQNNGTSHLIARETDLDMLENYVLNGSDDEMRAVSFSRLTGWWHWEKCDAFSHVTYSCTPVDDYDHKRALRLCEQVLATTEPYMPWTDPTPPLDALREGAREMTERVLYGRVFMNDATFVGEQARKAAAALGQTESVEHWLLGCLRFCSASEDVLYEGDYPYLNLIDAREDRRRCQQELTRHGIAEDMLASALWQALLDIPPDDGSQTSWPLANYLDVAQRSSEHGEAWEVTVCDLLNVILRHPSETICVAINRLALLDALTHRG